MLLVSILQVLFASWYVLFASGGFQANLPPGCDQTAALKCEYEFLLCKLFNGPANDKTTLCNCASVFYGECLRLAGVRTCLSWRRLNLFFHLSSHLVLYSHISFHNLQCETAKEVGPLTTHEIYMKTCVDFIIANNCPDPLICGINCASDTSIDTRVMKIIPFNNYGETYLRIRTCLYKVHQQRLQQYSTVVQVACSTLSDFEVCSRFIPPQTFVPVALPLNTTYIEIDNCEVVANPGTYNQTFTCSQTNPSRVYGNQFLFPRSFDVAQTNTSVCTQDGELMCGPCLVQVMQFCIVLTVSFYVYSNGASFLSLSRCSAKTHSTGKLFHLILILQQQATVWAVSATPSTTQPSARPRPSSRLVGGSSGSIVVNGCNVFWF